MRRYLQESVRKWMKMGVSRRFTLALFQTLRSQLLPAPPSPGSENGVEHRSEGRTELVPGRKSEEA